jgi:hypothetical protein
VDLTVTSAELSVRSVELNVRSVELNVSSAELNVTSAKPSVTSAGLKGHIRESERHVGRPETSRYAIRLYRAWPPMLYLCDGARPLFRPHP